MSAESVAVVRRAFEAMIAAIGGGDAQQVEWSEKHLAADVEWHEDPGLPGATDRIGREAAVQGVRDFGETLGITDGRIEELIDAGDAIVVLAIAIGRSPAGQVPTEYGWAFVVRVRDGKLGFVRAHLSRDDALESVGLPAAG
jgi:ketosteroid isomerase-like protein